MGKRNIVNKIIVGLCAFFVVPLSVAGVNASAEAKPTKLMVELASWEWGDDFVSMNKLILSDNFNPFTTDSFGRNAYDYAVEYGVKPIEYALSRDEFKSLYRKYSKEEIKYSDDLSSKRVAVIRMVAKANEPALTKFLASNPKFNLNYNIGEGISPLSAVILIQDIDRAGLMFEKLISEGADPNYKITKSKGSTVGHIFVAKDNYLLLMMAIGYGYDISLLNDDGQDVLDYAKAKKARFSQVHLKKIVIDNY